MSAVEEPHVAPSNPHPSVDSVMADLDDDEEKLPLALEDAIWDFLEG